MNKSEFIEQIKKYKDTYPFFFLPLTDPFGKKDGDGKRPTLLNWTNITNIDFDKELEEKKNYNLGVRTGISSNIIVIDFDMELKTAFENGIPVEFAQSPYWIKTGSGKGYHYYFKYVSGVNSMDLLKILVDKKEKKVELKCEGKQVVFPPSIHPVTKKEYKFGEEWNSENFNPPDFPLEAYRNYLKSRETSFGSINISKNGNISQSKFIDLETILKTYKGARDTSYFDFAVDLRNNGIPKEATKNFLNAVEFFKRKNLDGYEPMASRTLAEKVNSAYSKNAPVEIKLTSADELLEKTKKQIAENKESKKFKTSLRTLDENLHSLKVGNLYIIVAMSGRGKSFLTNQIFLENINDGKCMFISTEMSPEDMFIRSIQRETGIDFENISNDILSPLQKSMVNEAQEELVNRLKENESSYESYGTEIEKIYEGIKLGIDNNYKFFILDHVHNLTVSGKNDYDFFSSVYHNLQSIALANRVCILVADQLSMETQKDMNLETINVKSTSEGKNVASAVLVLTRDIVEDDPNVDINALKIHLAKNRFGRSKTLHGNINFPSGIITETLENKPVVSFTTI